MPAVIGFLAAAVAVAAAISGLNLILDKTGKPRDDFYRAARTPEEAAAKHRSYAESRSAGE